MSSRTSPVLIHLYDLTSPTVNTVLSEVVGIGGAFHAAVEVYGVEWSFGYCQYGCGIFAVLPKASSIGYYRESLAVGECQLEVVQVVGVLEDLRKDWSGKCYDLLNKNCTHFCDVFLHLLFPERGGPLLPRKVIRLAELADTWIRGLIATDGPPPERVTISTVAEESIMLRDWQDMWDSAVQRMRGVAWSCWGYSVAVGDGGVIHSMVDYEHGGAYTFDRECRSTYQLHDSVVRLAIAQFAYVYRMTQPKDPPH
ncbi:hypothetical protein FOL47_003778 [Perkinsus chesapeaki]|uniref:PPPDE domain-containing protein n=1 Tax=Perkinsus chesapeaki TaxID=330153 RepID=A0A7J6MZM6_PERCH|nr:hypothetical protein FOL47_003778 [Perkinsus chesapeaki]